MSVKVAVRVRPYNDREKNMDATCCIKMNGPQTIILDEHGNDRVFTFDFSFWSHDAFVNKDGISVPDSDDSQYADQDYVYDRLGKQVLDNAWDGYHCCLFAYGQTGSGKSYSMVGYGKNEGIVPKACNEIFRRIKQNDEPNNKYEVQFSMLEIYNERVQDLLLKDQKQRPLGGLKVRENKGSVYVQDLSKHAVDSYELIAKKMDEGYTNRSIGATQMNQTSSRAHTIITIEFKQIRVEAGRKVEKYSVVNLVDLAGSEKAGQTGAEGQRLKEGCAINQSLTTLGNCISILAEKAGGKGKNLVVPYRNSNLTRILQNALGGNSKTIMICAISPASVNYEESLSTLRYADRAKKIVNKAVVNESVQDKIIRELRGENEELKKLLLKAAQSGQPIDVKALGLGDSSLEDVADIQKKVKMQEQQIAEMEKTWEEKLNQQRQKDELERKRHEENTQKENKRGPHLTNLNEDTQLSGKLHYSLANVGKEPFTIGKHGSTTNPNIILRGAGIQTEHANFSIGAKGEISLNVQGQAAFDQTLVNGKYLQPSDDNFFLGAKQKKYTVILNHLDRICIGASTMFLFRYPLQKFKKEKILEEIKERQPDIDPEEATKLAEQKMAEEGITGDTSQLTCHEYSDQHIKHDEDTATECFESALREAQEAEEQKTKAQIVEHQKVFENEKQQLEKQFKSEFLKMKQAEEKKIQELKREQELLQQGLKQKEEEMKEFEAQQAKKHEQQRLELEEQTKGKVDKKEVDKLQEELERVHKQIEWQKMANQKIVQEQAERLMKQREEMEEKFKAAKLEKIQSLDHSANARKVKEANEICKQLNLNMKFRQIFVKHVNDNSGRLSIASFDAAKMSECELKEELKIQVQNFDKGGAILIWTEQQFEDRLAMMRDGLAALEDQKQMNQTLLQQHQKEEEETLERERFKSEIFGDDQLDEDNFEADFFQNLANNVSTDFLNVQGSKLVPELPAKIKPSPQRHSESTTIAMGSLAVEAIVPAERKASQPKPQEQIESPCAIEIAPMVSSLVQNIEEIIPPKKEQPPPKKARVKAKLECAWAASHEILPDIKPAPVREPSPPAAKELARVSIQSIAMPEMIIEPKKAEPPISNPSPQPDLPLKTPPRKSERVTSVVSITQEADIKRLLPPKAQPAQLAAPRHSEKPPLTQTDVYSLIYDKNKIQAKRPAGNVFNHSPKIQPEKAANQTNPSPQSRMNNASQSFINQPPPQHSTFSSSFALADPPASFMRNNSTSQNTSSMGNAPAQSIADFFNFDDSLQKTQAQAVSEVVPAGRASTSADLLGMNSVSESHVSAGSLQDAKHLSASVVSDDDMFWKHVNMMEEHKQPGALNPGVDIDEKELEVQFADTVNEVPPAYYQREINPQQSAQKMEAKQVKQAFLLNFLSKNTPIEVLRDLYMKPIPQVIGVLQFTIHRNASGMNKLFPKYTLKISDGLKTVIVASKISGSTTSHYKIIIETDEHKEIKNNSNDDEHLGRLRANLKATQYYIYGNGKNPKEVKPEFIHHPAVRRQYGTIFYNEKDSFGKKVPRKLEAYIPTLAKDCQQVTSWEDSQESKKADISFEYIQQRNFARQNKMAGKPFRGDIMFFTSNDDIQNSTFGNRVSHPSKKNFQLTDEFDNSKVYLQFGRAGADTFNMDVAHPFSIFQAFSICLSTFDTKF